MRSTSNVDGSAEHSGCGAGVAIFVLSEQQWYFAGVYSSCLPAHYDSYMAEVAAATFGLKVAHDMCKVALTTQPYAPEVIFKFDALTVGQLTTWKLGCSPITR